MAARKIPKSAISGRFVTAKHAKRSPKTTYLHTVKKSTKGK